MGFKRLFTQKKYFYPKYFNLKKHLLLFVLLFAYNIGVSQGHTLESNLKYLSSDDRKGRANGSVELLETALWLAAQYKEIGLIAPEFTDDYLQKITLVKTKNTYKSLILNSLSIEDSKFFTLGQFERINVSSEFDFKLFIIGEEEDINNAFSRIIEHNSSYAVFVHPIHADRFARFKRYFTKGNLQLANNPTSYSLWVLTDAETISNIQLVSTNNVERVDIYNVIGELPSDKGSDRKWIYSAHYDHLGIVKPVDGDSIANGADDDASGVAGILELAKMFSKAEKVDKSLYFVAFAGEELGLYGSKYLANTSNLDSIEAMINLEMIGKPNIDLGPESAFISGYNLSYIPKQMASNLGNNDFMLFPDPYPQLNLFRRSDNAPFAAFGVAAHSISSYSEDDKSYHSVTDEYDLLDLEHIQQVIDAVYDATLPMLSLDYDPGIIDYRTKNDR